MIQRWLLFVVVVGFISASSAQSRLDKCKPKDRDSYPRKNETQCQLQQPACGLCGCLINVTLIAKNILQPPFFQISANIYNEPMRALLSFLQKAADLVNGFKFRSTYFAGLGYFIDSINGLEGSIPNQTFWHFSSDGVALQCGASSYVPRNGETILFNFTTYQDAGFAN
ncbi:gastric intrinsic factor [Biomphalaria glabrata]|uniref:Cobalamin binding intrinsic factor-like n=1 Tax=Biomphalaria glabrata TaxID=6526 RepID=A0A9W2ZCJ6_BIOGL|nr:cobalamin binding intrinsic factor-like [Biomphalaria glabrata]KAI8752127.1 gastric intrinsic factor-like; partial [Biomphalaria glabrata]KAI8785830.1 gastric intrinsic factor [Biomphalaria glabrata]